MEKTLASTKNKVKNLWSYFTTYEKIWFFSILILAFIFAFLFPEEDVNGVNGKLIMGLYLADTFLNILCELLISKQSKWNFIVSLFVEITEIAICVVLSYRFATMASTLFFWIPIDIISFVNWHKHPDKVDDELTEVRKLSGIMEAVIITGIVIWTVGVGYFLTTLEIGTDLFGGNELLENITCYLDACASAVGIANGVFILLRYREQWIAWYICAILEAVINIISGQYVLLILKVGYLTNTTYGYIKWTKYINKDKEKKINKRSIGKCILLSIITLGIYKIYWMYLLVKNTHLIQKDSTSCAKELLCLIFIPFYSLYWWYVSGDKLKRTFINEYDYTSVGKGTVYLTLSIIGLNIVSLAIMQSDFNSLTAEYIQ